MPDEVKNPFDGIEIELDGSGELVLTGDKASIPEEKASAEETPAKEEPAVNPYETRISGLEAKLDQMANLMIQMAQGKVSNSAKEEPTLDQELSDVTDTKQLVTVIKNNVQKLIEHNFASLREDMKQVKITNEFHQLHAKYGEDFRNRASAIGDLMQEVPGLSMEKAYQALVKISPKQETKTETPKTKPASNLVEKAKKLSLDSKDGENGQTIQKKKEIKNIADAVNQAFEDLYT